MYTHIYMYIYIRRYTYVLKPAQMLTMSCQTMGWLRLVGSIKL